MRGGVRTVDRVEVEELRLSCPGKYQACLSSCLSCPLPYPPANAPSTDTTHLHPPPAVSLSHLSCTPHSYRLLFLISVFSNPPRSFLSFTLNSQMHPYVFFPTSLSYTSFFHSSLTFIFSCLSPFLPFTFLHIALMSPYFPFPYLASSFLSFFLSPISLDNFLFSRISFTLYASHPSFSLPSLRTFYFLSFTPLYPTYFPLLAFHTFSCSPLFF